MSRRLAVILVLLATPLGAHTWPTLQNGSFDREIWPWAVDFPTTASVQLVADDANLSAISRAAELSINGAASTRSARMFECVAVDATKLYVFGVRAKLPADQAGDLAATLTLTWYANDQCEGKPVSAVSDALGTGEKGAWRRIDFAPRMTASGATHVLFALSIDRDAVQGPSIRALFDDAYMAVAGEKTIVPAIASIRGAVNSDWSSDLHLVNRTSTPATVLLMYRCMLGALCNTRPREFLIPATGSVTFKDAAAILFESPSSGGAIEVWSSAKPTEVLVTSRLNSRATRGTFGTEIPAVAPHTFFRRVFPGVRNSLDYRTNLGLYNAELTATDVRIEVYVDAGLVATRTLSIAGQTLVQVNAFEGVAATTDNAWLRVVPTAGTIVSFVSVIDNATNDVAYSTGFAEPVP